MSNNIYNNYMPRNEHQMCEMFEVLLFMRINEFEEFIPEGLDQKESKQGENLKLNNKEIKDLSKKGIINRIFRRWYQTNWGYEKISDYFAGETPRQELSRIYPGINQGKDYLSVNLIKQGNDWKIKPYYYSERFLQAQGGLFLYGLKKLGKEKEQKKISEPFFDLEFKEFINWLDFAEQGIDKAIKHDYASKNDFFKYWNLFLKIASTNIVLNLGIEKLNEKQFCDFCFKIRDCLINFFASQSSGKDNYLYFDQIFSKLWEIIRKFDKNLMDYKELIEIKETGIKKIKKDKRIKKSIKHFHTLGITLDRYILFPIERYFGGAETVWTDKQLFLNDLYVTIQVLKGNIDLNSIKNKKKAILDANSFFDLRYAWFSPCTTFRLIGPVFQYFH